MAFAESNEGEMDKFNKGLYQRAGQSAAGIEDSMIYTDVFKLQWLRQMPNEKSGVFLSAKIYIKNLSASNAFVAVDVQGASATYPTTWVSILSNFNQVPASGAIQTLAATAGAFLLWTGGLCSVPDLIRVGITGGADAAVDAYVEVVTG